MNRQSKESHSINKYWTMSPKKFQISGMCWTIKSLGLIILLHGVIYEFIIMQNLAFGAYFFLLFNGMKIERANAAKVQDMHATYGHVQQHLRADSVCKEWHHCKWMPHLHQLYLTYSLSSQLPPSLPVCLSSFMRRSGCCWLLEWNEG